MIRNLKALGLALVAMFAMSAIAATAAQADTPAQLTVESGVGVGNGVQIGEPTVLNREGRTVTCDTATYEAPEIGSGDTTITVVPAYAKCHSPSLKGPVTVTMNGCDYLFHLTVDHEPVHTWTAVADLVCPAGKSVVIDFYATHTAHTAGTLLCQYTIPAQAGFTVIDLTNEPGPPDWIRAHIDVTGIDSTRTAGTVLNCGALNGTNATLTGEAELTGEDEEGEPTGITISTDPPKG